MKLSPHNLFDIFLESSSLNSKEQGMSSQNVLDLGYTWMIYRFKMEIYKRPMAEENLKVQTWVSGLDRTKAYRDHRLADENDNTLALASSVWTTIDLEKLRPSRIPQEIIQAYTLESRPNFDKFTKFKDVTLDEKRDWLISLSDLDYNRHVNSGSTLRYLVDSNKRDYDDLDMIEIYYKKQIYYEDEISIYYDGEDDLYQQIVKDGQVLIHAKSKWSSK